jgi:hypothetical protein
VNRSGKKLRKTPTRFGEERIIHWGGPGTLAGRVRRVEPAAFTKISTLGVEEQRVNVLIDIISPAEQWARLGDAYQIDAQIVVFTQEDATVVPAGALFRRGDQWNVYVVKDGCAQIREVQVLRRSGRFAAIASGLKAKRSSSIQVTALPLECASYCASQAVWRATVDLHQRPDPACWIDSRRGGRAPVSATRQDMSSENPENVIEIRVNEIAQLFHTLDPFPFREKDLDREAEEYIVGWARELPRNRPFRIVVHLPDNGSQTEPARDLQEAFSRYFADRATAIQGDLNELLRIGRRSLAIGVAILVGCLLFAHVLGAFLADAPFRKIVEESFLILGWVANWRPLEIFLYDWWPLARRRDLYRRLSAATVEKKPYAAEAPGRVASPRQGAS